MMANDDDRVERARTALGHALGTDPRGDFDLAADGNVLTVSGEVQDIAQKRRALRAVAAIPGVGWVADRLRVAPTVPMTDGEIRVHVLDALTQEPAFELLRLELDEAGAITTVRDPPDERGSIRVSVEDGVVTLDGVVPSLSHERLAGVLCWWIPGTRDVVDALDVAPPEDDDDGEIAEAVRLVLEKDPLLDATQIGIDVQQGVVRLYGTATSDDQRRAAERDVWFIAGVADVVDAMEVRSELRRVG